ncbi:MAG: ATP-binding protein [Pseudomonadota bacterium]
MFGKYKVIVTSIALMMAFVVGGLSLNVYLVDALGKTSDARTLAESAQARATAAVNELQALPQRGEVPTLAVRQHLASVDQLLAGYTVPQTANAEKANADQAWQRYRTDLAAVDADPSALAAAIPAAQAKAGDFSRSLEALSAKLLAHFNREARKFKLLQVAVIALAVVFFGVFVFYLLKTLRSEEEGLAQARRETEQILATVSEGLFLLDKDGVIGSEVSTALIEIFRREDFEDVAFRDLLQSIVPEKTLNVAMDFVDLLWSDRVNENLVKDLNPLNEVEVNFQDGGGAYETRYLAFDFNQVKLDGQLSHILVTVTDITDRILLARELEESQAQSQAQLDLLLSILHVDPKSLREFLHDSDAAMERVNATLKKPARDVSAFRQKLNDIFREVHRVKGEAATLGLTTIEVKAHDFEDDLGQLRERETLNGNDFLPLAIKLDDLLSHLASVRDLISRLSAIQVSHEQETGVFKAVLQDEEKPPTPSAAGPLSNEDTSPLSAFYDATSRIKAKQAKQKKAMRSDLTDRLQTLAATVSDDTEKLVELRPNGLDVLPSEYASTIKDIAVQLVRNAITHGIESPEEREKADKTDVGTVKVSFGTRPDGQYELRCEDDGRGISAENIKISAVNKGLITAEQAADMEDRRAYALLFEPGFSTAESVGKHAGRGVGMDVIKDLAAKLNGRIGLKTTEGKGSMIRVLLPRLDEMAA